MATRSAPRDRRAQYVWPTRCAVTATTPRHRCRRRGSPSRWCSAVAGQTVPASWRARLPKRSRTASRLLDEREREILENHLVNEVASTLQELISDAEHQVVATNAELAGRPDEHRHAAATALARAPRTVRRVFPKRASASCVNPPMHGRRRTARRSERSCRRRSRECVRAMWQEHGSSSSPRRSTIARGIGLRSSVNRVVAGVPPTGPASGGERVLTASVPLFAAASSYYASAGNDHAPRLVMLDEVFAGVDDDARAKCLGLLTAFDLDVVMTSEREWGCYREVPGLAIAQLSRVDDVAAVLVSHWEWDGATRARVERPVSAAAVDPTDDGSLLAVNGGVEQSSDASLLDGHVVEEEANGGPPPGEEGRWGTPSSSG